LGQTWGGLFAFGIGLLFVVAACSQLFNIDQAWQERFIQVRWSFKVQFIDHALPPAAAVNDQVFELFEFVKMPLQLPVAPARVMPDIPAAEPVIRPFHLQALAFLRNHLINGQKQAARLRRQFIQATAKHLFDQILGKTDIFRRGFDVFQSLGPIGNGFQRALILVKQRDGSYQCEELHVIPPRARQAVGECQLLRVGIHNG